MINLNSLKAGELAALYILANRGYYGEHTPEEIQYALEGLVGDLLAREAVRQVSYVIDHQ